MAYLYFYSKDKKLFQEFSAAFRGRGKAIYAFRTK